MNPPNRLRRIAYLKKIKALQPLADKRSQLHQLQETYNTLTSYQIEHKNTIKACVGQTFLASRLASASQFNLNLTQAIGQQSQMMTRAKNEATALLEQLLIEHHREQLISELASQPVNKTPGVLE